MAELFRSLRFLIILTAGLLRAFKFVVTRPAGLLRSLSPPPLFRVVPILCVGSICLCSTAATRCKILFSESQFAFLLVYVILFVPLFVCIQTELERGTK